MLCVFVLCVLLCSSLFFVVFCVLCYVQHSVVSTVGMCVCCVLSSVLPVLHLKHCLSFIHI